MATVIDELTLRLTAIWHLAAGLKADVHLAVSTLGLYNAGLPGCLYPATKVYQIGPDPTDTGAVIAAALVA